MSDSTPIGDTGKVYAATTQVNHFSEGMERLATLFHLHPELRGLAATVDSGGHVDIIAVADHGVLRDWIRALPGARHHQDLYSVHYGHEREEVLIEGPLTVHVRRPPKVGA